MNSPTGVALDPQGAHLYIADSLNNRVREVNLGSGTINTIAGNGTGGYAWAFFGANCPTQGDGGQGRLRESDFTLT